MAEPLIMDNVLKSLRQSLQILQHWSLADTKPNLEASGKLAATS